MQLVWGAIFAVASLAVGCGGGMTAPPPKPPTVQRGLVIGASSTSPLELGERLVAEAEALGMSIGTLDMRMTRSCSGESGSRWSLDAKLGTAGVLRWFNKTQGYTRTIFDPKTLRPERSTTLVIDGDEWRRYEIEFTGSRYTYRYEKSNGEKKTGEGEAPEDEPVYDTQTAYTLLRSWQPKPKEQSYFYVVLGKDLWRADVKYRGGKTIDVDDEKVSVFVLEGTAHRIDLKPGDEYSPRKFSLLLTADERRVPIQVIGDGSVGAIHFNLKERSVGAECNDEAATIAPDSSEAHGPPLPSAAETESTAPEPRDAPPSNVAPSTEQ